MAHIGIAGLGRMGSAMALRLLEQGHALAVWNRSPGRTVPVVEAGAGLAASPAELVRRSEIVITILTDAAAIEAVYGGPQGILAGGLEGKLVIEMSTVRPETAKALASRIAAAGGLALECPVGGSIGPARQGRLIGLAGGSEAAFARARPVLEGLCRRLEHCGPAGAGSSMKLAINLPLMLYYQALAEAMTLCGHLGRDPAWLIDLFGDTTGGSNVLKARGGSIAKALCGDFSDATGVDLDLLRKDMRTMLEEARALGAQLPITEATLGIYDRASAAGWGGRDGAAVPAYWPSVAAGS
jgi:3-hydroxyisobutyrate dehydrogenase